MPRLAISADQGSLFGYISPLDASPCLHPPLCACGSCQSPVESFGQPAAILGAAAPEDWEED